LTDDLAGAIGFMLEERLSSSCKVLCRHFGVGEAASLRILHDKLGLKKILSSLGAPCLIDQPEDRKSIIFEAPSDGTDRTEGERLLKDYH
jgi:hypothetical protein